MSETKRGRGRPHKWHPQIIAGWRQAKGASIAETAKKWSVSADTVKRACRDHGEGALLARQDWFIRQHGVLIDRQLEVFEKRGGYLPVVRNLARRIGMLEAGVRETEAAMALRGIAFTPSRIGAPSAADADREERRKWDKALGIDGLDEDNPWENDDWEMSSFDDHQGGW